MELLAYGESGWLLDCGDSTEARRWYAGLAEASPAPAVADVVLGARTVLVVAAPGETAGARRVIEAVEPVDPDAADLDDVVIAVAYDGPDLDHVARHLDLSTAEVIELHTGTAWTVAFCGFAPGFGYLTCEHDRLVVPRRPSPRARIDTGSVGLAGPFSGVYPRASPGGWQIIGHTDDRIWEPDRNPPARLQAGSRVVFEERR